MSNWKEENVLRQFKEAKETEETFYSDAYYRGPMAKKIANMYKSLLDMGKNLPSQINLEDYLNAKKALEKLWINMTKKSDAEIKKDIHRTEDGEYPEEGMFITASSTHSRKIQSPERSYSLSTPPLQV